MYSFKVVYFASILAMILSGLFITVLASGSEKDIKIAGANISIVAEDVNSIYAAGARILIEGKAKDNAFVAGALIDIDTEIDGNLYVAGSKVNVKGTVAGVARVAGADIKIDADIGEVLNAVAASIEITENAMIASDSSLAAGLIEFHGAVKNNLTLYADEVVFTGQVSGSVSIEGHNVRLDDTARIDGDLTIRSSSEAVISPNATIVGKLTKLGLEDSKIIKEYNDDSYSHGFFMLSSASVFLLGLILVIFARGFVEQGITMLRNQPGRSVLWGLGVFFGFPIFVIVTMVTIIGIPISVATLLLLPFFIILGFTMTTLGVSDWIMNRNSESKKIGERLLLFTIGVILLIIVRFIPFLGGLLILLAAIYGLGAASITIGSRLGNATNEVN